MTRDYKAETVASISALAERIIQTNLCKEIFFPLSASQRRMFAIQNPPKYQFSRANWYIAEFDDRHYFEVEAWCSQQFGPHPKRPDAWSRWYHKYENKIHFSNEKDYLMFLLRWGV